MLPKGTQAVLNTLLGATAPQVIGHASGNENISFDPLFMTSLGTSYGILVWKIIINGLKQTYNA